MDASILVPDSGAEDRLKAPFTRCVLPRRVGISTRLPLPSDEASTRKAGEQVDLIRQVLSDGSPGSARDIVQKPRGPEDPARAAAL